MSAPLPASALLTPGTHEPSDGSHEGPSRGLQRRVAAAFTGGHDNAPPHPPKAGSDPDPASADPERAPDAGTGADPEPDPAAIARGGLVRGAIATLAAIAMLLGAFSTLVPLSQAVIVMGTLGVKDERVVVQAAQPGIVLQRMVAENALVRRGQPLLVLENEAASVERERTGNERFFLDVAARRLREELREGASSEARPAELASWQRLRAGIGEGERARGHFRTVQGDILRTRLDARERERGLRRGVLGRLRDARAGIDRQIEARRERIERARDNLARIREALGAGVVRRDELIAAERDVDDQMAALVDLEARAAEAARNELEAEIALSRSEAEFRQRALDELAEVQRRATRIDGEMRAAADAAGRLVVTAPVVGHVQGLNVREGNVVRSADALLEIVPSGAPLVATARVLPAEIDAVALSDAVEIRVLGLDARSPPTVQGRVTGISRDVVPGARPDEPDAYEVTVTLDTEGDVTDPSLRGRLRPGLELQLVITGRERTLLDYMAGPIARGLGETMRER